MISQISKTGIANRDRKNTASPGGISPEVALIRANMLTKMITDRTFRVMPRTGFNGVPVGLWGVESG